MSVVLGSGLLGAAVGRPVITARSSSIAHVSLSLSLLSASATVLEKAWLLTCACVQNDSTLIVSAELADVKCVRKPLQEVDIKIVKFTVAVHYIIYHKVVKKKTTWGTLTTT